VEHRYVGPPNAYKLTLHDDGNAVIEPVNGGRAIWATNTAWWAPGVLRLQPGQILTTGQELMSVQGHLKLQPDGNLVLYRRNVNPEQALWASNTVGKPMDANRRQPRRPRA
jgi:hypothetical protein